MWEKLVQLLLTYVLLPLLMQAKDALVAWFKKRQAEGKTNSQIDAHVDELEKSTTKEEQREALKKLVEGVRSRRNDRGV